jgi:hypothetical protein
MILDFIFSTLPKQLQVSLVKRKGILVGTKKQDGRKHYIYILYSVIAEIQYRNDDPQDEVEILKLVYSFSGLSPFAIPFRERKTS